MDCPACQGNGELELVCNNELQSRSEPRLSSLEQDPRIRVCPACGGSGYLEEAD